MSKEYDHAIGRMPKARKCPRNPTEGELFKLLQSKGLEVTKRGWPDFTVWHRSGDMSIVEVKKTGHCLKYDQHRIMKYLASCGVRCFVWKPWVGLSRVLPNGKVMDVPLDTLFVD